MTKQAVPSNCPFKMLHINKVSNSGFRINTNLSRKSKTNLHCNRKIFRRTLPSYNRMPFLNNISRIISIKIYLTHKILLIMKRTLHLPQEIYSKILSFNHNKFKSQSEILRFQKVMEIREKPFCINKTINLSKMVNILMASKLI